MIKHKTEKKTRFLIKILILDSQHKTASYIYQH